jgi:hypothetical protein
MLFEHFDTPGLSSLLQLWNGLSWTGNSNGLGVFPWTGTTNDPRAVFNRALFELDLVGFGHLRLRHQYSGGNATTLTWANPANTGEEVLLPVSTNMQTVFGNRVFPVPVQTGLRLDPVPGSPVPAGNWLVDYMALDRGRVLGWEFSQNGNARGGVNNPVVTYGCSNLAPGVLVEGTNGGAVANGLLAAMVGSGEPRVEFLVTPPFGLTNFVETSIYRFAEVRLRASTGGWARLQFANASGGFGVNQPAFNLADDGAFHTYLLDFRNDAHWNDSRVTALALALPEVAGLTVELDYLRLLEVAAVPGEAPSLALADAVELEIPPLPAGEYVLQSSADAMTWTTEEEIPGATTPTNRFRSLSDTGPVTYRLAACGQPPQWIIPLPPVTNLAGTPLVFPLPPGTFVDADGHDLRYSGRVSGGLPLPDWLTVNPRNGQFSGTAPLWLGASNAASVLALEIVADDQVDGTASAALTLALDLPPGPGGPTAKLFATQLAYNRVPDPAECWAFGDTNRLSEWAAVRSNLHVLKLYIDTVNNATTQQLQNLAAVVGQQGIKVAIEMGGLLGEYALSGDTNGLGEWSFSKEMPKIQKWLNAGGTVHHLEFDDPINRAFYPKDAALGKQVETGYFTLAQATAELLDAMKLYRQALPGVKFVYLANFPNWGWDGAPAYYTFGFTNFTGNQPQMGRGDFKVVLEHVLPAAAAAGLPFWAVCADHPRDYFTGAQGSNQTSVKNSVNWRQRVRALEIHVESKGLPFILIANDQTTGNSNATDFQNAVADYIDQYQAEGGSPYAYNIQSWYNHPTVTLPETVNGRLAKVILNAYGRF